MSIRLVVLGRDGVINRIPRSGIVRSPDEWHALPGSLRAIARLTFARFHVVVVTNQPGIGEGSLDSGTLIRIHARMHQEAAREGGRIDAIFYCAHAPAEACECRLPKPGLLQDLRQRLGISLEGAPFVSAVPEDAQAVRALGMHPLLLCPERERAARAPFPDGMAVYPDLAAAAEVLIRPLE